ENCRMHAVDAIFIAGSSVLPMGPLDHSNEFDYPDCSTTQSHEASKLGSALGHSDECLTRAIVSCGRFECGHTHSSPHRFLTSSGDPFKAVCSSAVTMGRQNSCVRRAY